MKKSRFTHSQILAVLKQSEAGVAVPELCREHGISSGTFYKWRSMFGGMGASLMARMKELGCCRFRGHQLKLIGPDFQNLQG